MAVGDLVVLAADRTQLDRLVVGYIDHNRHFPHRALNRKLPRTPRRYSSPPKRESLWSDPPERSGFVNEYHNAA